MRLYNFDSSPNPAKIRMALAELDINCEMINVNLFNGEQRRLEFLELNPIGKVPVLQDGTFVLRESNAILAYLGREYGGTLWPKHPQLEATALQWLFFESEHMASSFGNLWFNDFGRPKIGQLPLPAEKMGTHIEEAEEALDRLEDHLARQPYMLGENFSLVDCSLGVIIAIVRDSPLINMAKWPRVLAYRDRIMARPSWSQARGFALFEQKTAPCSHASAL